MKTGLFKHRQKNFFLENDINEEIDQHYTKLLEEQEVYDTSKGSWLTLKSIDGLLVGIYKYIPLRGSSYIQIPADIQFKKCVINCQNSDDMCFKYSILSRHVNPHIAHRVGRHYDDLEDLYDFTHFSYPINYKDIAKQFEKFNPLVSVTV